MGMETLQWVLAGLTIFAGAGVVLGKNPVICALSLMVTMFLTGLLYFSQGAYFPGVVQILVYAGAISVLFIFIVMLLDLKPTRVILPGRSFIIGLALLAAGVFGLSLFMLLAPTLKGNSLMNEFLSVEGEQSVMTAKSISMNLLTRYMLPFQATALLILAALMGAIVVGRAGQKKEQP